MSGGSYNYACQRISEVDAWASTLEDMADKCRGWAKTTETKNVYDRKIKDYSARDVPLTIEDRAKIMVGALRLERAAERLRAAHAALVEVEELMHDVEWIASGDYGVDSVFLDDKTEKP